MTERIDEMTDETMALFLRNRSADAGLGLLDDIVRTAGATPQVRPWLARNPIALPRRAFLLLSVALLAAALGAAAIGSGILRPASPFSGTWISTGDADGGTQTMTVTVPGDGIVEITIRDTIATVCGGTPSTMTGTGRIENDTALVIPEPDYTCDDGSRPETVSGPPLDVVLRNWTLVLDAETDTLSDGVGGLWFREDAPVPSDAPVTSGGMWPQTTLAEAQAAQERADAGDPAYTWQLAPQILDGDLYGDLGNPQIIDRFIHDQLGWEDYRFNPFVGWEQADRDLIYVRCAPGETNAMYPDDDVFGGCAPTIDQFQYETVRIDLLQPIITNPSGIWVVDRWATTTPFAQADPSAADALATARLEDFLDARIAGQGAEGYVEVDDAVSDVPLMYLTSDGTPFERYQIERVGAARWPYGNAGYAIRLFANGGATVVEQPVTLRDGSLYLDAAATTENGRPLPVAYSFFGGRVTFAAADPWKVRGGLGDWGAGTMGEWWSTDEGFELATCDPAQAPENAKALAHAIQAGIGEAATTPVAVTVGGVEGFLVEATIDTEVSVCGGRSPSLEIVTRGALATGIHMRYYLLDLPDGASPRILVIAIAAPESTFEAVTGAAAPIIESISFH